MCIRGCSLGDLVGTPHIGTVLLDDANSYECMHDYHADVPEPAERLSPALGLPRAAAQRDVLQPQRLGRADDLRPTARTGRSSIALHKRNRIEHHKCRLDETWLLADGNTWAPSALTHMVASSTQLNDALAGIASLPSIFLCHLPN